MSSVDNRVVKMTFDNAQFEKKIKSTMEILSQFEKSLKMDGATAGFDEISKAADKLDISTISDKASDEADKVAKSASDASSSIEKIDDAAANTDFSAISDAALDAADGVNQAANSTDFSPMSNGAQDTAMDINNAAASIDMSPITEEVNEAAESFNALEMIAAGVLLGIGGKISEFAMGGLSSIGHKMKEYVFDPITDGFKEYETQMGSIQTIMANTGMDFSADEDIATVNAALDELNTYADKTIYNFTEMTRNIGTFTAAGVDLETSKNAIQGIANLAALSGSNSQQASTAMYQLSQALSTGTLKLQDWNSVVNAGMGGEVFQNALKETARAHDVAVDEIIEANGSFRESLQEGWITSEILTETLNHMAISYEKVGDEAYNAALEEMVASGYTEEQAVEILRLAKVAEESATKVRTWSQLWDTVKEAIGSQWSAIWRNFIGDFKQATDTFTFLSNTISDGVSALFGGLIKTSEIFSTNYEDSTGGIINISKIFWGENLRVWNENTQQWEEVINEQTGHFKRVKGAMDYLVRAFTKPLGAIRDAFNTVFGMDDATIFTNLYSFISGFKDFAKSLIISNDAATAIRQTFEGFFAVLDIIIHGVIDAIGLIGRAIQGIRVFLDPIIDIVLTIFGQVGKVLLWIHDKILEVREAIIYALYKIGESFGTAGDTISGAFKVLNLPETIQKIGDGLIGLLEVIWDFVDIPAIIGKIGDVIGSFAKILFDVGSFIFVEFTEGIGRLVKTLFDGVAWLTGWSTASEIAKEQTEKTGEKVSTLSVWIDRLLQNPVVAFFKGFFDILSEGLSFLTSMIDGTKAVDGAMDQAVARPTALGVAFAFLERMITTICNTVKDLIYIFNLTFGPTLLGLRDIIKTIATVIGNMVINGITLVINALKILGPLLLTIGYNIVFPAIEIFAEFMGIIIDLGQAFGDFISRLVNFILAWGPLANVISIVKKFKNKVVDYIISIPEKIAKAFGIIEDGVNGFSLDPSGFFGEIEKIIDYFNTVTPEQFIEDVKNFFGGIRDTIVNFAMDIPNKLKELYDKLTSIKFEDIANAILEGLSNVYKSVNYMFKTGTNILHDILVGFFGMDESDFSGIVDTIRTKLVYPINNIIGDLWNIVKNARDNSESIPEFFGNLFSSLGTYIWNGLTNIYNTVAGKIKEIFDYISSIDYNDVVLFIEGLIYIAEQALANLFSNIENVLFNLIGHFFGYDNAAMIVGILNNYVVVPILNTLYEIFYWIDWARRNSTDLPSFLANLAGVMLGLLIRWGKNILKFIGNVLKDIGLIFVGGIALIGKAIVDSIKLFISGEGTEEIKESWRTIGTTINNAIRGVLDKISPKLREVYDKIIEFFFGSEEKASKFGEIFNGIKDTVKNAFTNISNVIGDLKDKIVDNFDKILTKLSEIDGPIGDAFTFIKDKIDELKSKFDDLKLPTSFGEFVDKVRELFTGLKDALKSLVFGNGEEDKLSIFERLKEIFGDKAEDIWNKLKNLPAAIAGFFDSIVSNISMETVQKVIDIVELILKARLVDSLRELMSGIGKLSKAIAKKIRREEQESIQDVLRSIAITFAIIGGVILVLSMIPDPWPAVGVLAVVGIMILGMQAVSTLLSKWQGDYKSGEDLLKAALSIAAVAGGILLMLHTIEKLTEFDFEANKKGLLALGGFLLAFLGVYAVFALIQRFIGDGGKNAIQVAIGIGILGIALRLLMGPIQQISEYWRELDPNEIKKTGQGLLEVSGFIAVLAFALSLMPKKGAIGGALAMVIMAAAVSLLVDALVLLAPVAILNPIGMLDIILGIALLMGAFAAIAQVCKAGDLILTSVALVLFNAGLAIMIESLAKLALVPPVNMQILLDILLGIGLLIAEYAAIAQICNAGDLMLTSVAIILFSAAIYVIASALAELAEVDPETLKASAIAIGGIMAVFGVLATILSIPVISQAAMIIIPLLAVAFVALGAACLMIAKALQMTVQGLAGLGMVTPILLIFVNAVASNAIAFGIAAIALAAIGAAFLVFGPGAMLAGAGLMLLSTGIREFLVLIADLPVLLQNASTSIQTLLGMLPDFIANLWTTVSTWFTQTFLPGLGGFFENIFSKLGELKDKFMTWWNETAWPMISETASRFWNWVQTDGIPKLGEFILWIFGKLGELKDTFLSWLGTDGLPMLQNAAGTFWNWVVTEGIPKLGEFIGKVMGKLGELISKVWNWIRTEGLPAAAKWVSDMVQKAKDTFGPKIENFIKGIPKKIKEAIEGIWEDLKDKGKQIANGLADGISGDDSKSVVSNAVTSLSRWIPQGVKDFFGIQSPSKLMKYEIGRYIPEGLAAGIREFAPVAGLAAKKLAEETLSGVNDGFDGAEYATPKLTPVIDINDFSSGIDSYNKMLEDSIFGGNATYSGALSGELALSSQLASMIDADMSRTDSLNSTMHDIQQSLQENSDKTEELYMYTASILDALNGNTSAIRDSVADGMKIYMDSGAMVGALAPEMDRALGRRAALAERGVY